MKVLRTLIAGILLCVGASAMAQATYKAADGTQYLFQKHWFLDLQGGAQYTLGEAKFNKLISPNVQAGIGYQFNPVIGARLAVNAWQSKGGFNFDGVNTTYKYKYFAPSADAIFNLSNLVCGWNPNRVFNLSAYLGVGFNYSFESDEVNDLYAKGFPFIHYTTGSRFEAPVFRGGLEANFRVSDAVSIMLEGNANGLNDHYNYKHADNCDWYFNALLGVRINLGKTYTKVAPVVIPEPTPEPTPEPEPIVEPAPEPEPEPVIEPIRRDVFFTINSTKVSETEEVKVQQVAEFMKKYPQSKVTITGYADKGTGNARINKRLAAGRADVVVKELVEKYGISADRISYDSKGDTVQPFAENDLNRVAICITNL